MLRKFGLLIMVLTLLLVGCRTAAPVETTEPTAVTEVTEPVETEAPAADRMTDAGAVYRQMALKVNGKWLLQYTTSKAATVESADASYRTEFISTTYMNTSPLRICCDTESIVDVDSAGMKMSMTDQTRAYIQVENGVPVTYVHYATYDKWYRYEMEEMVGDIMYAYSSSECVYPMAPEDLTMDSEPQTLEGREVYVLRCTMSGTEAIGPEAEDVELEYVYYVDVEDFMLLRMETIYHGMDDYLMEQIRTMLGAEVVGDESVFTKLEMKEILYGIRFEDVEVPELPQEGIDSAVDVTDVPMDNSMGQYL